MKTNLIEFKSKNTILRGVLTQPKNQSTGKAVLCIHGFERTATTEKKFK